MAKLLLGQEASPIQSGAALSTYATNHPSPGSPPGTSQHAEPGRKKKKKGTVLFQISASNEK